MIKAKGFTLIELLVVMVLLGLMTGVAVSTIGGGNQARELDIETNRLHALLRAAANESIFSNTEIGVRVDEKGYGFLEYDEEEQAWVESTRDLLRSYAFPEWMEVEFQREGEKVELPTAKTEESVSVEEGQETPDFMLLSSGEITDFMIRLSIKSESETFREIRLDENGSIVLPHVEDDDA